MRQLSPASLWPALVACLALFALAPVSHAAANGQKIHFETYDKVDLQGTWYPSSKAGASSPAVLLLHKIGGNRSQEGWDAVIEKLSDAGFAVLSFDFRGHGDSTSVAPEFWQVPTNLRGIKGANPKKDTIAFKDFAPNYMPMLINDIAAARHALEQKNNAKECISSDIIVVGAEDGGTLGLMWMATEWIRRPRTQNPMTGQLMPSPDPAGKDLAAGIFLSIRPRVGSLQVPMSSVFSNQKMREMPICFFYGDEDKSAKDTSKYIYTSVLRAEQLKLKLTFSIPLQTKLAGNELLGKSAKTEDLIAKYVVEKVMEARAAKVWGERELRINPLIPVQMQSLGVTLP